MPLYYKQNSSWKEFNPNPYPIGTLYYATKDVSPASLVGGTWKKLDVSSKEELTGIIAKPISSTIGTLTDFAFYHDGSEVTGTITWLNGNAAGTEVYVLSGLPTVPSSQTIGGFLAGRDSCRIYITKQGELVLEDVSVLRRNVSYTTSVSYTTNQILGGADFVYERTA